MIVGIYQIVNLINGNKYIGSSCHVHKRWKDHLRDLKSNKHHSIYLQRAWNKYGEENFKFEIITKVDTIIDLEIIEKYYIDRFTNLYNVNKLTDRPPSKKGIKLTQEHKDKIKIAANHLKKKPEHYGKKKGKNMTSSYKIIKSHLKFPLEIYINIFEDKYKGLSNIKIARKYGVDNSTISSYISKGLDYYKKHI